MDTRGRAGMMVGTALLWASVAGAQQPASAVPVSDPTPTAAASSSASRADAARTLTLEEAVEIALERNHELAQARLTLESANAQVKEAWGNLYPALEFNASYTRNLKVQESFLPAIIFDPEASPDDLIPVRFGSDNNWYAQLRADQSLFEPGVLIGVGAAGRYKELQQETVRGSAQSVATQVRLSYYDVLLTRENVRLTAESVARVAQVLDETKKMNQAGLSSDYDVLRLEVELANLEPNLRRAENQLESARRALAVQLGLETLDSLEVEGSLLGLELPAIASDVAEPIEAAREPDVHWAALILAERPSPEAVVPEEALEYAIEHRSDLRQLALTESLRETELKLETAQGYLPKLSLFGTYTVTTQQNGGPDFFGGQKATASQVGVELRVPIFSGFQRSARVAQRRAVVNQVEQQRALAVARAENEVKTLVDEVREARQRALAQRRAVRQATRGFEIARTQYRSGLGSQLEVTDAELALRQSEFNYAQSMYDFLTAQAQLDLAMGQVPIVDTGDTFALGE